MTDINTGPTGTHGSGAAGLREVPRYVPETTFCQTVPHTSFPEALLA